MRHEHFLGGAAELKTGVRRNLVVEYKHENTEGKTEDERRHHEFKGMDPRGLHRPEFVVLGKAPENNQHTRQEAHRSRVAHHGRHDQQKDIKGLCERHTPADDQIGRFHKITGHKNKGQDREA